jgi:hypothetical protein
MRGLVQMAIDQESSGNVRDLLYGIDECLNVMANFAHAVLPNEEGGESAVSRGEKHSARRSAASRFASASVSQSRYSPRPLRSGG